MGSSHSRHFSRTNYIPSQGLMHTTDKQSITLISMVNEKKKFLHRNLCALNLEFLSTINLLYDDP